MSFLDFDDLPDLDSLTNLDEPMEYTISHNIMDDDDENEEKKREEY